MGRLTHTVSGSIASLRTPSRVPIESLKFHFLPKQASGTPSPENPIPIEGWTGLNGFSANENLISLQDLTFVNQSADINTIVDDSDLKLTAIKNTNTWAGASQDASYAIPSALQGKEIFFSIDDVTLETVNKADQRSTIVCEFRDANNTFITDPTVLSFEIGSSANTMGRKITIPSNAAVMKLFFRMAQNIRDYGVLIGDYIIFHNFCIKYQDNKLGFKDHEGVKIPITFPVAGTNKLDPNDIDIYTKFELVNGVYRNTDVDTRTTIQLSVQLWKSRGSYIKTAKVDYLTELGRHAITFDVDEPECQYIVLKHNGMKKDFILIFPRRLGFGTFTISCDVLANDPTTIGGVQLTNIQLEVGDTAHAFEPYSSDNTFYGGYIDPVAGEIVAEYGLKTLNGTEANWTASGDDWNTDSTGFCVPISEFSQISNFNNALSNLLVRSGYYSLSKGQFFISSSSWANFRIRMTESMTLAELKSFLAQNNMKIAYPLATPIHIPIPAEDMKAFLDHNNFWSDANDVTEVTYPVTESKDILATRKCIMSQTWDNMIPLKYQPVDYISAKNSNPYIDMGIQLTGELEAEVHYYNDTGEAFLFGVRKDINTQPYCNFNIEKAADNRSRLDYGNKKGSLSTGLSFTGYHDGEFIFKFHNRIASMERVSTGETVEKDFSGVAYSSYTNYNMLLFAVNTNGKPSLNNGTGELRVYSAKFWLGGQLVRDFVPCVRKSDSKPGMYDRVSKTFFTNVGSGEFAIPT